MSKTKRMMLINKTISVLVSLESTQCFKYRQIIDKIHKQLAWLQGEKGWINEKELQGFEIAWGKVTSQYEQSQQGVLGNITKRITKSTDVAEYTSIIEQEYGKVVIEAQVVAGLLEIKQQQMFGLI